MTDTMAMMASGTPIVRSLRSTGYRSKVGLGFGKNPRKSADRLLTIDVKSDQTASGLLSLGTRIAVISAISSIDNAGIGVVCVDVDTNLISVRKLRKSHRISL